MPFEAPAQGFLQTVSRGVVWEALQDFIQKSERDQPVGVALGYSPRLHVKEFIGINFARGGAVGTADVIGQDFKTRQRVCLRIGTENQVAHFLEGVRPVRVWFDADEPGDDRLGFIVQGVLIEQVAASFRRTVVLQGALVELLVSIGHGGRKHVAASACALELADAFAP